MHVFPRPSISWPVLTNTWFQSQFSDPLPADGPVMEVLFCEAVGGGSPALGRLASHDRTECAKGALDPDASLSADAV